MADDINYQLILTKLEEKLKKYRGWNDTVKVRMLNADIQQLKAYLNHQRGTPPNLSRWLRPEDYRRTALLQEQIEAQSSAQPPIRIVETVEPEEQQSGESSPQNEPPAAPTDWVAEDGSSAADEAPTVEDVVPVEEEPQQPNSEEIETAEVARISIAEAAHPVEEEPGQSEQEGGEIVTEVQTPATEEIQPAFEEIEEMPPADAVHPVAEEPPQPEESEEGVVEVTEVPAVDVVQVDSHVTEESSTVELEPLVEEDEQQQPLPSAEEIVAEAEISGRSSEHFQEEISRIDAMISGTDKELTGALLNCEGLWKVPDLSEAGRMQLGSLKREAEEERDRRYASWMEKGRTARKDDKLEEARQAFSAAYQLTKSNEAANAIAELNLQADRKISELASRSLESELIVRTDIGRLEKAVREAEALIIAGQLPDRLLDIVQKARADFDDMRNRMNQITTSAAIGDLSKAFSGVQEIQKLIDAKQATFIDRLGNSVPIQDALLDANRLWEDRSREFVSDSHIKIEKWLKERPDQPEIALSILNLRLFVKGDVNKPQPIHDSVKEDLEVDKKEIDLRLALKKQAQEFVDASGLAENPIRAFDLLLKAHDTFPFLEGLSSKTDRSRRQAIEYLTVLVGEQINSAIWEKDHFNFSMARQAIEKARSLVTSWPDIQCPDELKAQSDHCLALATQITADEHKFKEFSRRFDEVKKLEEDGEITRALEQLEDLLEDEEYSGDERYKQYTRQDLRALNKKLNASKSSTEKLEKAHVAISEQDWEVVRDLTDGLAEDEAKTLHAQAVDELRIQEAFRLLHEDQIGKAKKIMEALTNHHPEQRERLQAELEKIRQAVEATPAFQALYDQADRDARKKGVTEQAGALRLFRYLGGKPLDSERIPSSWPAYRLSLLTAPARERAAALGEQMRASFLADLVAFYRQHQANKSEPGASDRRIRAAEARALREALLLQTEEERVAARWIELKHGISEAEAMGAADTWDKAVAMWEELDLIYPLTPAVQEGLRRAYIQQALLRMHGALDQGHPNQALTVLQTAQQRSELIDSVEIKFGLSEVYEKLKEFTKAQDVLKTIRSRDAVVTAEIAKRGEHLKREAAIHQALEQADDLEAQAKAAGVRETARRKLVRGALEALKAAQDASNGDRSRRLDNRFNDLYRDEELHLLETVDVEVTKRTPEGNLQALLAIVDLEQLEDLKGISAAKKNSRKKLAALKGALEGLVTKLIRDARKLDPNPDNFDFISDWAAPLFEKVNDLRSKLQIVSEYSHDSRLDDQISRLSNISANLARLLKKEDDAGIQHDSWQDAVLEDGRNSSAWQKALATNDFSILERVQRNLEAMRLQQVYEVKYFIDKLAEVKQVAEYLNNGISEIRVNHHKEEYHEVIEKIDGLRERSLMDEGPNLEIVDDDMYSQIYTWVSLRLSVHVSRTNTMIKDWSEVRKDAEQCEGNYIAWSKWIENIESHMKRATAAINLAQQFELELPWGNAQAVVDCAANLGALPANSNRWLSRLVAFQTEDGALEVFNPASESFKAEFLSGDYAPLTYRLWSWIAALKYVGIARLMLEGGPGRFEEVSKAIEKIDASAAYASQETQPKRVDGKSEPDLGEVLQAEMVEELENFPVLSKKALAISNSALTARGNIRQLFQNCVEKLKDIYNQIDSLNGYPLPGEFAILQKSKEWKRFEGRLQEARKIGPANRFEANTYRIYKETLLKHDQEKEKPFFSRFLGGI